MGLSVIPCCVPIENGTKCDLWNVINPNSAHKPGHKISKTPRIKWEEFQQRIASEEEIRRWWTNWPNANIGIVTGNVSKIVVIDLDGAEGIEQAKLLGLSSSVKSISGNGIHLWFKHPGGIIENSVKKRPGIDIRGDGGYILAPPGIHSNGKRYRWANGFGVNSVKNLPILPELFRVVVNGAATEIVAREKDWIAQALEGMKIGNIDDTLVSILGRLRYDGYSSRDAYTLLYPHAIKAGAVEGHLEEKIENIWRRYEPRNSSNINANNNNFTSYDVNNISDNSETLEQFLQEEESVKWLIPNLLAKQSIGFVVGLPESSKTWLCMDLAIAIANGTELLNVFAAEKNRVLFIEQERFRGETKRRFKALLNAKQILFKDCNNLIVKSNNSIKIDMEQSYNAFCRLLEKVKPELVIVDSLATFHMKEENNRMEIQSVMEKVKHLRDQFQCAFLFISHPNKFEFQAAKEGQEPNVGSMAGSIAIPAVAETVFFVRKEKGGGSMVYHIKSTLGQKQKPFGFVVEDKDNGVIVRGIK